MSAYWLIKISWKCACTEIIGLRSFILLFLLFIDCPIIYVPSICCLIFLRECKTWLHFLSLRENEDEFLGIILIKLHIPCTWKGRVERHSFFPCGWMVQLEEKAGVGGLAAGWAPSTHVFLHTLWRAEKHRKGLAQTPIQPKALQTCKEGCLWPSRLHWWL